MGYGGSSYWSSSQKPTAAWGSSGWRASGTGKSGTGKHVSPWKRAGNDGCGYFWNIPQHRLCCKCSQHWDFEQRLSSGKPAASAIVAGAGHKPAAPGAVGPPAQGTVEAQPDPSVVASERDALCVKLRSELLSISVVLGADHVDVVSRTAQLEKLVK